MKYNSINGGFILFYSLFNSYHNINLKRLTFHREKKNRCILQYSQEEQCCAGRLRKHISNVMSFSNCNIANNKIELLFK